MRNNHWIFYLGICCVVILTNLEVTVFNLALPTIIQDLSLRLSHAQAILSAYLLGALTSFLFCGRLADRIGEILIYRYGIIIFFMGTLFCSCCSRPFLLILGRFIQGVGFAASFSMALVLIRTSFSSKRLSFILGLTTMLSGFTQSIGPAMGSWILEVATWRWIFFLKLPLLLIAFIISFLKKNVPQAIRSRKFDIVGFLIWIFSMSAFFLIAECSQVSLKISLLFLSFVAALILIFHSSKSQDPFFPFRLFSISTFRLSVGCRVATMFYFSTLFFIYPLYLQNIEEWSTSRISNVFILMTASYGATSLLYGIIERHFPISLFWAPFLIGTSCLILLAEINYSFPGGLYIGLVLSGIGFGISMPQTLKLSLQELPRNEYGIGMGLFCSFAFLGSLLGVCQASSILELNSYFTFNQMQAIQAAQGIIPISLVNRALQVEVKNAFVNAFGIVLVLNICLSIGSLFLLRFSSLFRFQK